jgi:serine phosphatase RsbU (regulator of sigma subunit)
MLWRSPSRVAVGGDWFDVIRLSGSRVGLVVGDVVGHGIHSAATMGRLRTAVRTLADIDLEPGELLTRLDDVVTRLADEEGLPPDGAGATDLSATCLYAVYDPVSRCCTLARAGHPPPALAHLSERWGSRHTRTGKTIWAQQPLPADLT